MKNSPVFAACAAAAAALIAVPLALPMVRVAHAQTPVAAPGGMVKFKEANLSFAPMQGYRLIPHKDLPPQAQQAFFAYVGPSTSGFASNLNLVMQTAQPGVKADVPSAEQLGNVLKKANPTYKKVGTGALTVGGEKAAFVSGTFMVQSHAVQAKQVLVVHGGKQYVLTFSTAAPVFSKQVGAFDKMVASLKWL